METHERYVYVVIVKSSAAVTEAMTLGFAELAMLE